MVTGEGQQPGLDTPSEQGPLAPCHSRCWYKHTRDLPECTDPGGREGVWPDPRGPCWRRLCSRGLGQKKQVALPPPHNPPRIMGQSLQCLRGTGNGRLRSRKKRKRHHCATSQQSDSLLGSCNQVNLNLASEEELMTLPGVSRSMAHSITVYRHRIGGFRKVEDLALVSGFGAEKMQQLRSEICVGALEPTPRPMLSSCLDLPSSTKVNLNTATVAQLLRVGCISEELAQAVVSYRTSHGVFRRLKDLEKINGVDEALLKRLEPHLTISLPRPATIHADLNWEDFCAPRSGEPKKVLISANGPASQPAKPFSGVYSGRPVVRVGSCTLQGLTLAMAEDQGLREELCLSLLENGITLLAIQDVLEEAALETICREMETPSLANVRDWPCPRGSWRYVIPELEEDNREVERPAFLWDSTSGLELLRVANVEIGEPRRTGENLQQCQPLLGHFKAEQLDFKLLNVHLKSFGHSHVAAQLQSLRPYLEDGPQLLVLGVFRNGLDLESFGFLQDCGFHSGIQNNVGCTGRENPLPQKNLSSEISATDEGGSSAQGTPPGGSSTSARTKTAQGNDASGTRKMDVPVNIWCSWALQAVTTGRWRSPQNGLGGLQTAGDRLQSSVISESSLMWVELYKG